MKKMLKGCGCVVAVVVLAGAGLLTWAYISGGAEQRAFFTAVGSGDPAKVTALMDPALKAKIDEPVLAAWMKAFNAQLGPFVGLDPADFHTTTNTKNGVTIKESKGTVKFQKGTAECRLVLRNGLITDFSVKSDKMKGVRWFDKLPDTTPYRARGKECLTMLLSGQVDKLYPTFHESLQKAIPLPKLKAMMANITRQTGPVQSVKFLSERFQPQGTPTLTILYNVVCQKGKTIASVTFQFAGWKGHLTGFDLQAVK